MYIYNWIFCVEVIALCIRSNTPGHFATGWSINEIQFEVDASLFEDVIVGMIWMWLSLYRVQTRWQVCFLQISVVNITNLSTLWSEHNVLKLYAYIL